MKTITFQSEPFPRAEDLAVSIGALSGHFLTNVNKFRMEGHLGTKVELSFFTFKEIEALNKKMIV